MEKVQRINSDPMVLKVHGEMMCVRGREEGEKLVEGTELTERQLNVVFEFSKLQRLIKQRIPAEDIYGEIYTAKPKGGK